MQRLSRPNQTGQSAGVVRMAPPSHERKTGLDASVFPVSVRSIPPTPPMTGGCTRCHLFRRNWRIGTKPQAAILFPPQASATRRVKLRRRGFLPAGPPPRATTRQKASPEVLTRRTAPASRIDGLARDSSCANSLPRRAVPSYLTSRISFGDLHERRHCRRFTIFSVTLIAMDFSTYPLDEVKRLAASGRILISRRLGI
jgi:hypothetical protein